MVIKPELYDYTIIEICSLIINIKVAWCYRSVFLIYLLVIYFYKLLEYKKIYCKN